MIFFNFKDVISLLYKFIFSFTNLTLRLNFKKIDEYITFFLFKFYAALYFLN